MNNAKIFLSEAQLNVILNTPGALWDANGYPALDDTVGSELERFFDKNPDDSLIDVEAEFIEYDDAETGGKCLRVGHFTAWTETAVLIILDSIFGDKYMAAIPRNPPKK